MWVFARSPAWRKIPYLRRKMRRYFRPDSSAAAAIAVSNHERIVALFRSEPASASCRQTYPVNHSCRSGHGRSNELRPDRTTHTPEQDPERYPCRADSTIPSSPELPRFRAWLPSETSAQLPPHPFSLPALASKGYPAEFAHRHCPVRPPCWPSQMRPRCSQVHPGLRDTSAPCSKPPARFPVAPSAAVSEAR